MFRNTHKFIVALFVVLLFSFSAGAVASPGELCTKWPAAEKVGGFDASELNEASGIAVSSAGDRLFHTNDSGDDGRFFSSKLDGSDLREYQISGFEPRDVEALGLGPCGNEERCLFVGDIGDNKSKRDELKIVVIREGDIGGNSVVRPKKTLRFRYPDGAHNAEGLEVHPSGDIYILTKESFDSYSRAEPALMFRLPAEKWQRASRGVLEAEFVGALDLPKINSNLDAFAQVATGFGIHPSGKKFVVLTYLNAIEFAFDLAEGVPPRSLKKGVDFALMDLKVQEQQEAIVYSGADSVLYSTEVKNSGDETGPLHQLNCR